MEKMGLILEGGGMRCAFTAGVLDFFLDAGLDFHDVYGVSAGAGQVCSYLCRQKGRGLRVWTNYLNDPRFCSWGTFLKTGDLFGVSFNYDLVPRLYDPIDNDAFLARNANFIAVVTNVETGDAEYLPVRDMLKDLDAVRASASLPLVSRAVRIGKDRYLDGGVADPLPIRRSVEDGHNKNVVVLTRAPGYIKHKDRALPMIALRYADHPKFVKRFAGRHLLYNETLDFIEAEAQAGRTFVIRPDTTPDIGRIERDKAKLEALHDVGYDTAKREHERLMEFLMT